MDEETAAKPTRQERLAAKLRENLRRRKAQSRAQSRPLEDLAADPLPKLDADS